MSAQIGDRFGKLVVIGIDGPMKNGRWLATVRCDCGTTKSISSANLYHGKRATISCGCSKKALRGGIHRPTYMTWLNMMDRCYDPTARVYHRYGGRGIAVCESWHSARNFVRDMGERPPRLTLGRINNDGNYELDNCRWETQAEQCLNRCTTRLITANGKTLPLALWIEISGLGGSTILGRLKRGWSEQDAVTLPPQSVARPKREIRRPARYFEPTTEAH